VEVPELHLRTTDPDATRAVATVLARYLEAGDVVALTGELGAGKTCFVQGAASGLGVEAPVTSPTFVLVRSYQGRLPMVHCDVYRLDRLGDVLELGDEVLAPDVVTFVEWGDAIATLLPPDHIEVELTSVPPGEAGDTSDGQRSDQSSRDAASDPDVTTGPDVPSDLEAAPDRRIALRLRGRTGDRLAALTDALATWQEPA
jgi:tRNA threonylcarbamoyladenosine biosynthesis protein TsaE